MKETAKVIKKTEGSKKVLMSSRTFKNSETKFVALND